MAQPLRIYTALEDQLTQYLHWEEGAHNPCNSSSEASGFQGHLHSHEQKHKLMPAQFKIF